MSIGILLSVIFMVLKLTHYIDWSWLVVSIPGLIEIFLSLVWLGGVVALLKKLTKHT